jgi:uncharacterized protein YbjQ (UPF0145 family)
MSPLAPTFLVTLPAPSPTSSGDDFRERSKSDPKQIASINDAALKDLRQQTAEKGGTALVGLAVDHDQISEGG